MNLTDILISNIGAFMYKRIFICIAILLMPLYANAENEYNKPFTGFNNIAKKQKIVAINMLQSVAEYNNLKFTQLWPGDYFNNKSVLTYFYYGSNEGASLDLIKFDIDNKWNDCDPVSDEDYCIPKVIPNKVSYRYNERLIADVTPNFLDYPQQHVLSEVLEIDGSYYDTVKINSNVSKPAKEYTALNCIRGKAEVIKSCKALDSNGQIMYSEELFLKNFNKPATIDNMFKYVKRDAFGRKIEEYNYSTNKHTFYGEDGSIIAQIQLTDNSFLFYNNKLPNLYIDLKIIRDEQGRPLEEIYNERGAIPVRKYVATYKDNEIDNIYVYDFYNYKNYKVIPISKQFIEPPKFQIRL